MCPVHLFAGWKGKANTDGSVLAMPRLRALRALRAVPPHGLYVGIYILSEKYFLNLGA